jgi:DNA-directed RNA polymerase specialized sigma24 family protein
MVRGDDEFVEFATASWARLYHVAYLLTGDRHDAEDAAQTALVRTYAAWQRIRRRDPYAYARAVLTNQVTGRRTSRPSRWTWPVSWRPAGGSAGGAGCWSARRPR